MNNAEYLREWRKNNPDLVTAYRLRNLNSQRKSRKRWKKNHPEIQRESKRKYALRYPEKVRERNRRFFKLHPEHRVQARDRLRERRMISEGLK